jgi:hypothetical protein
MRQLSFQYEAIITETMERISASQTYASAGLCQFMYCAVLMLPLEAETSFWLLLLFYHLALNMK